MTSDLDGKVIVVTGAGQGEKNVSVLRLLLGPT